MYNYEIVYKSIEIILYVIIIAFTLKVTDNRNNKLKNKKIIFIILFVIFIIYSICGLLLF